MQTVKYDSKTAYFKRMLQLVGQIDMDAAPWMISYRSNIAIKVLEQLSASVDLAPMSCEDLKLAPANQMSKDKVLAQLRVVPVPIAAAILGVSQRELFRLHESTCGRYGGKYLRALSFSIAEMKIMNENPKWFGKSFRPCLAGVLESLAYQGTFVGKDIAEAYMDKSWFFLNTGHGCRPIRISDIRENFVRYSAVRAVA